METFKAVVTQVGEKHLIRIDAKGIQIDIPLSEDKPNEVKAAFNKLITRLKDGEYKIEFGDPAEDLFAQVAKDYISQLNKEIQEIYGEMQQYDLLKKA